MSEAAADDVKQQRIDFLARKWAIPEDEAERMLRRRQEGETLGVEGSR